MDKNDTIFDGRLEIQADKQQYGGYTLIKDTKTKREYLLVNSTNALTICELNLENATTYWPDRIPNNY